MTTPKTAHERAVEAGAKAAQRENRPKNDPRNSWQREAEDEETLPAYRALSTAAINAYLAALEREGMVVEERDAAAKRRQTIERRKIFENLMGAYVSWKESSGGKDGLIALGDAIFVVFPEYRDEAYRRARDAAAQSAQEEE